MPEGVGYGPQFTASTGFTLSYIGDHVYGLSGAVDCTNANETLMDFRTSDNSYIVANIQFGTSSTSGDDFLYSVSFNGVVIMSQATDHTYRPNFGQPLKLVIPPGTVVQLNADNQTASTARTIFATLTGRIVGKVD